MPLSSQKRAILQAVLDAQKLGLSQIEAAKRRREEIKSMGLLTEESDPYFQSSAAAAIRFEDVNFVRALPHLLQTIEKQKGDKGDDGYTPVKGKDYDDGKDGYTPVKGVDYFDGQDAAVNKIEMMEIADAEVESHKQLFKHELIHDSKMIGEYELDVETLQDGDLLQVKGKKLVGVKIQMPDINGLRTWVSSQGVSNFRSYPITSNTTIESMAIYVVDASAGNITVTVPSAAGRENFWFEILRIDSSANTVTVVPTGSETLSGETSYIMQQWTDLRIFAYNGSYLIRSAG